MRTIIVRSLGKRFEEAHRIRRVLRFEIRSQLHDPRSHLAAFVIYEYGTGVAMCELPGSMSGPQRSQRFPFVVLKQLKLTLGDFLIQRFYLGSLLQQSASVSDIPVIVMKLEFGERHIGFLRQIERL